MSIVVIFLGILVSAIAMFGCFACAYVFVLKLFSSRFWRWDRQVLRSMKEYVYQHRFDEEGRDSVADYRKLRVFVWVNKIWLPIVAVPLGYATYLGIGAAVLAPVSLLSAFIYLGSAVLILFVIVGWVMWPRARPASDALDDEDEDEEDSVEADR